MATMALLSWPVMCDFREPKTNPYWLQLKEVGHHSGLHNMEFIPISITIDRAHQSNNWHQLFVQTLPNSKMVMIAVAGGSGRLSLKPIA
jgi:hypothetical protein